MRTINKHGGITATSKLQVETPWGKLTMPANRMAEYKEPTVMLTVFHPNLNIYDFKIAPLSKEEHPAAIAIEKELKVREGLNNLFEGDDVVLPRRRSRFDREVKFDDFGLIQSMRIESDKSDVLRSILQMFSRSKTAKISVPTKEAEHTIRDWERKSDLACLQFQVYETSETGISEQCKPKLLRTITAGDGKDDVFDIDEMFHIVKLFLEQVEYEDYPDTDGSATKGFLLISGHWSNLFVYPCWIVYGK